MPFEDMELGFETVGNATLVVHDRGPVLVTDPWITGSAYFGSWGLSHEIPQQVMDAILSAPYIWISHGHPDHLSSASLRLLQDKQVLLPDHVGGIIASGLRERGLNVTVLKDRVWTRLSNRVAILCIADYNQDAIALVDVGGRLLADLNDAEDHGWGRFVKRTITRYDVCFLMHLAGFGDTDMINFFSEDGTAILPRAARRRPVGRSIANMCHEWSARYFVPFSSMHRYQRADSAWANEYSTKLSDYQIGFESERAELLPAFIRYDLCRDSYEELKPAPASLEIHDPKVFGDDWSEPLLAGDLHKLARYFQAIEYIRDFLDFINIRVAGKDHFISLSAGKRHRGLTFEAPRHSLMTAVETEIFDDMLIGNFMKVTLHGKFPPHPLYPNFTPYLTKYGDNGRAKTKAEVQEYFRAYMMRAPLDYLRHRMMIKAIQKIRFSFEEDSPAYRVAADAYHRIRGSRLPGLRISRQAQSAAHRH